ncbi:MAG: DNA phosphorothioation-associated protein 4 [Cyanosarcina radialis HA8281-LM2]|jgi:dnd system-associated protein 4|nr:DNA phosphorothioation-associated protein 4 [Cyanosarcina radialis HA8281-LM2]
MSANRIKIAKDKAELVKGLTVSNGTTGPFRTYVEVIVFAAALGVKWNKRVPIEEVSKKDPDPIPREHFVNNGYEPIINLIGINETQDKNIMSFEERGEECNKIFEEYANGGLEILREELRGSVDYTNQILLLMLKIKDKDISPETEFDLSKFL